jgi:uncharacterized membrane protein YfbV (UPF0208 family)
VRPWKGLAEKYQDAITFSHMKATPAGAFGLVLLATTLVVTAPTALSIALGAFSAATATIIFVFGLATFYYMYDYPMHFATVFRIKASAEMVLAVVYMTISMRISPNIENAIKFAADNLSGALDTDLNQLLWDVYTRKYGNASDGLEAFIKKWKRENTEFADSLYLIKTSVIESPSRREKVLDEAVSVMLQGTRERMKNYSLDLRTPVTVINALGILLPIIGLVFLPMVAVFMPGSVQPLFIAVGYNMLLPLAVYWVMKMYLDRRPYSFHHPDISKHPSFRHEPPWLYPLAGIAAGTPFVVYGLYMLAGAQGIFSFEQMAYSLVVSIGMCVAVIAYSLLASVSKIKLRDEIVQIENEFVEVLFQLGNQLMRGIPFESTLRNVTPQIRNLKISKFFERILYNIETFGMTLEQAVFDERSGAVREYPSGMINAVMKAIVEISKRGMDTTAKAMITISTYLKNSRSTEEEMKDMLGEVTSTMQMQAVLLAPLSSGIVVALSAMMMRMMMISKELIEGIYGNLSVAGALGDAGSTVFTSILNLDKIMPIQATQFIVGTYMIEVVGMIAIFLSIIENGDEGLMKRLQLGKMLAFAIGVYSVVLMLLYSVLVSIIPLSGLV